MRNIHLALDLLESRMTSLSYTKALLDCVEHETQGGLSSMHTNLVSDIIWTLSQLTLDT